MARRKNRPIRKTRTSESKPARRKKASSQSEKRNNPMGSYLLRHLQNFLGTLGRICRHPVSSLMTMSVIGIALALPAALYVVVENGRAIVGGWDSVADLSVYLDRQVSAQAADELARALRDEDGVAATKVIYADEALEQFRELSGFGDAVDGLAENPLPHLVVVRPRPNLAPQAIEALGTAISSRPGVDVVQMDTEWVSRFQGLLDIVRRGVALAALVLAVGVILIVGNTIRLDIENRRDEIEVSKLIGASDVFIRRPFLYSGFWYGLGGGAIALLIVFGGMWLLRGPVQRVAGRYGSDFTLSGLHFPAALAVLAGGAVLGWLGSWFASTRHLRQIEPGHDL